MPRPYQQDGLTISWANPGDPAVVRALQRDLRALGYLRAGIDGRFGTGTAGAVRALQYDLMHNTGASRGGDGRAAVAMTDYNRDGAGGGPAVTALTGEVDQALAACLDRLVGDDAVAKLPHADDAPAQNAAALRAVGEIASTVAPAPFIAAMVVQESGGRHYCVPSANDEDNFVVVGLDRGDPGVPDHITSRGYGIGQYTIFHHPPRAEDVADFIVDPARNAQRAFSELREKFARFVVGPDSRADDRIAEHPLLTLRACKYAPADARYLRDCRACAAAVRKVEIRRGTPAYPGASFGYQPDQYYPSAVYHGVPDRAEFPCDWPYAARRYNGSGNDSFHYQTRILLNLLAEPAQDGA